MANEDIEASEIRERINRRLKDLEKGLYRFISPAEVENAQFNAKSAVESPAVPNPLL